MNERGRVGGSRSSRALQEAWQVPDPAAAFHHGPSAQNPPLPRMFSYAVLKAVHANQAGRSTLTTAGSPSSRSVRRGRIAGACCGSPRPRLSSRLMRGTARFVHPQDANWPTAKYASEVYGPPRPRSPPPRQHPDTPARLKLEHDEYARVGDGPGRHRDLDRPPEPYTPRMPDYGGGPARRAQSPSPARAPPPPPRLPPSIERAQAGPQEPPTPQRTQPTRFGPPAGEASSSAPAATPAGALQPYVVDKRRVEEIVKLFRVLAESVPAPSPHRPASTDPAPAAPRTRPTQTPRAPPPSAPRRRRTRTSRAL
jgi:hypothetical protein